MRSKEILCPVLKRYFLARIRNSPSFEFEGGVTFSRIPAGQSSPKARRPTWPGPSLQTRRGGRQEQHWGRGGGGRPCRAPPTEGGGSAPSRAQQAAASRAAPGLAVPRTGQSFRLPPGTEGLLRPPAGGLPSAQLRPQAGQPLAPSPRPEPARAALPLAQMSGHGGPPPSSSAGEAEAPPPAAPAGLLAPPLTSG